MSGHDLVPAIFFHSQGDRSNDPALSHAFHELLHVFIVPDLKRMIRERVDLRQRDIIDLGEAVLCSSFIVHEQLIVRFFQT